MSTAARKARKRAGIRFERTPKVATPPEKRAVNMRFDQATLSMKMSNRHLRRLGLYPNRTSEDTEEQVS